MWENTHFRKVHLSWCWVQTLIPRTGGWDTTNSSNQSPIGKAGDTQRGQGFASLIPISFQKWRLQKLPKHPPNNSYPSPTIGKPLFMRCFTFSFKRGWLLPAPHGADGLDGLPVFSCLLQTQIKEVNEFGSSTQEPSLPYL